MLSGKGIVTHWYNLCHLVVKNMTRVVHFIGRNQLVLGVMYVFVRSSYIPNLNNNTDELVQMVLTLQTAQFYLFIVLSAIALYACSWLLSIRIYERKVF